MDLARSEVSAEMKELMDCLHGNINNVKSSLEAMCYCRLRAKGRDPIFYEGNVLSPPQTDEEMGSSCQFSNKGQGDLHTTVFSHLQDAQEGIEQTRDAQEGATPLPVSLHMQTTTISLTPEAQETATYSPASWCSPMEMSAHLGELQESTILPSAHLGPQMKRSGLTGGDEEGGKLVESSISGSSHMQQRVMLALTGEVDDGAASNESLPMHMHAIEQEELDKTRTSCPVGKEEGERKRCAGYLWVNARGEENYEAAGFGALPGHLQSMILALLPLHKVFELRMVCRSWNSLLRSRSIVDNCLEKAGGWFVMTRKWRGATPLCAKYFFAYVPSQQRFFALPGFECHQNIVSCLGLGAVCMGESKGVVGIPSALGYGISAADGLLCSVANPLLQPHDKYRPPHTYNGKVAYQQYLAAHVFNLACYSVVVFNPFTGAFWQLPEPSKLDRCLRKSNRVRISMFNQHNNGDNHYFVVLYDQHQQYDHMEFYDSKSGSWKIGQARSTAQSCSNSLPRGNLFYYEDDAGWFFAYDVQADTWSRIQVLSHPPMPDGRGFHCFPCNGKVIQSGECILLAAPLFRKKQFRGFGVWKLELSNITQEKACWKLLSRSPAEVWKPNRQHVAPTDSRLGCDYSFVTSGKLLCMTWEAHEPFVPIVYDLVLDYWFNLPSYLGSYDYVCLLYFQPSLNAKLL